MQIAIALFDRAVRIELHEAALERVDAVQIGADLVECRLLRVVELVARRDDAAARHEDGGSKCEGKRQEAAHGALRAQGFVCDGR